MADYIKQTFALPPDVVDQQVRGSDMAEASKRAFLIHAINEDKDTVPEPQNPRRRSY